MRRVGESFEDFHVQCVSLQKSCIQKMLYYSDTSITEKYWKTLLLLSCTCLGIYKLWYARNMSNCQMKHTVWVYLQSGTTGQELCNNVFKGEFL